MPITVLVAFPTHVRQRMNEPKTLFRTSSGDDNDYDKDSIDKGRHYFWPNILKPASFWLGGECQNDMRVVCNLVGANSQ